MPSRSHGMSSTPIYGLWCAMKRRCENKNVAAYKDYGGRGIRVCERWQAFENFFADMGHKPEGKSLDRIDNSKGYCKENCKWSTAKEQKRNARNLRYITAKGKTQSMGEWAEEIGLSVGTIWQRLSIGWTDEESVTIQRLKKKAGIPRDAKLRHNL